MLLMSDESDGRISAMNVYLSKKRLHVYLNGLNVGKYFQNAPN